MSAIGNTFDMTCHKCGGKVTRRYDSNGASRMYEKGVGGTLRLHQCDPQPPQRRDLDIDTKEAA